MDPCSPFAPPSVPGWTRFAEPPPPSRSPIKRFEQPVPKVTRNRGDTFETAADVLKHGIKRDFNQPALQQSSRIASATQPPKPGASNATSFQQRDGFESATRKPVELSPKPPPSFKPAVAVFRFR